MMPALQDSRVARGSELCGEFSLCKKRVIANDPAYQNWNRSSALSTLNGWVARREGEAPAEPCPTVPPTRATARREARPPNRRSATHRKIADGARVPHSCAARVGDGLNPRRYWNRVRSPLFARREGWGTHAIPVRHRPPSVGSAVRTEPRSYGQGGSVGVKG
jgi:hypothetical protein